STLGRIANRPRSCVRAPPRGGRMTIRKMAAVAGTAALALVLTSCAESQRDDGGDDGGGNAASDNADDSGSTDDGGESGEAAGNSDATFVFGAAGAPASFDPFYASDGETFRITRQIYENLIGIEPGGTQGVPELATEWEGSEDGLTWT